MFRLNFKWKGWLDIWNLLKIELLLSSREAGKRVHRKDGVDGPVERVHPMTKSGTNFSQTNLFSLVEPVWICGICQISMVIILTR